MAAPRSGLAIGSLTIEDFSQSETLASESYRLELSSISVALFLPTLRIRACNYSVSGCIDRPANWGIAVRRGGEHADPSCP